MNNAFSFLFFKKYQDWPTASSSVPTAGQPGVTIIDRHTHSNAISATQDNSNHEICVLFWEYCWIKMLQHFFVTLIFAFLVVNGYMKCADVPGMSTPPLSDWVRP